MGEAKAPEVFLRKATGLIRQINIVDVWVFNVVLINLGIGFAYVMLLYPFYPGGDLMLALLWVSVGCFFQSLTYAFLSSSMPRSGGEYVYIGRILHPALAFMLSLNMVFWLGTYIAFSSGAVAWLGLATLFTYLGGATGSAGFISMGAWLQSPWGMFLVGSLIIWATCALLCISTKGYFRFNNVTFFGCAMLGTVIVIILLAIGSQADFITRFNEFSATFTPDVSDAYHSTIEAAKNTGYVYPAEAPFSWYQTLLVSTWFYLPLAYAIMCASYAGEIKDVKKTMLFSMPGAVVWCAVFFALLVVFSFNTMGGEFLGAISWAYYEVPESYTLPISPWITLLHSLLTNNVALNAFIALGLVFWAWYWAPGCVIYPARVILAWAFDRLAPGWMGDVNDRFHTPVKASITICLVAQVYMVLFAFTPWVSALVGVAAMVLTFLFIGIAGILFPFGKSKEIWNRSPVKYTFAGIPLVSITGAITAIFMAVMFYAFMADPLSLAQTPLNLGVILSIYIGGIIAFYAIRAYRKRQGIDIDLAFKEVPVE